VPDVPEQVLALVRRREERRRERDFTAADALRDRIEALGYVVADSPEGPRVTRAARSERRFTPTQVPSVLGDRPRYDASVQWLVQGWPDDVRRGIDAFRRHHAGRSIQHVVVDAGNIDPAAWPPDAEVVPLDRDHGWGVGRNVGLRRAAGRIVVVVDGSVEVAGNVLGPLETALADPTAGVAGPFGLVTSDLRTFRDSGGPEVDAVEGYLMAFRREVIASTGGFDERFRFYRAADIEFSFRVKDRGLRNLVVALPVIRHEHRAWADTPPERREQLSKRNFYRFLDRWRGRLDLCVGGGVDPATRSGQG
jgi:hypothetical protein